MKNPINYRYQGFYKRTRMGKGTVFSLFVSPYFDRREGGVPNPAVWRRGVSFLMGYTIIPSSFPIGGSPSGQPGVPPSGWWGYPRVHPSGLDGVPARSGVAGIPPSQDWMGVLPPLATGWGYPRQKTERALVMPLAFTQEDFLVLVLMSTLYSFIFAVFIFIWTISF